MQSSFTRILSLFPARRRHRRLPSRTCVSAIWKKKRERKRGRQGKKEEEEDEE
jgi:hypothetical protein